MKFVWEPTGLSSGMLAANATARPNAKALRRCCPAISTAIGSIDTMLALLLTISMIIAVSSENVASIAMGGRTPPPATMAVAIRSAVPDVSTVMPTGEDTRNQANDVPVDCLVSNQWGGGGPRRQWPRRQRAR